MKECSNKEIIESYIKKCGYTWKYESVLKYLKEYYKKGYYISNTMKDIIKNNIKVLEEILDNK